MAQVGIDIVLSRCLRDVRLRTAGLAGCHHLCGMAASTVNMEAEILEKLAQTGEVKDSEAFCRLFSPNLDHKDVVGALRSLEASDMVVLEVSPEPPVEYDIT